MNNSRFGECWNDYGRFWFSRLMTDVRVFNLSPHRVSLSTVGVVPRLKQLQDELPNVSLALSLHAPTQEIREKIVPSAKVNLNDS